MPGIVPPKPGDLFDRQQHASSPNFAQNERCRRVKRKQSSRNLSQHSGLDSPFEPLTYGMDNVSPQNPPYRPLSPDYAPQQHNARSPSLSSTATTVPSTPEMTPISLRSMSPEFSILDEAMASAEPIRTKRNFPRFKQAKRLPRWKGSGASYGPGIRGENNEFWEVYAAVFDPAVNFDLVADEGNDEFIDAYYALDDIPAALQLQDPPSETKARTVQFETTERRIDVASQVPDETHKRVDSVAQNDQTSPLSLFRFQFPPPPRGSDDLFRHSQLGKSDLYSHLTCQDECALIDL